MSFVQLKMQESPTIEFLEPSDFKVSDDEVLNSAMRAAEAHRRVRYNLHKILKPGVSLRSVVNSVEENTRILLKGEENNGIGFPCGISLNDCAAHFTLNPLDQDILLKETDVLKIDFGTHCNGYIIDSAFTVCFDEKYENLLLATKEATEAGIKRLGVDSRVKDIGRDINEVITSYELDIDGKSIPIKQVMNLNGHSIERYKIHGKFSIPQYNNGDTRRIEEGFYAIETFATTGIGEVDNKGESSHFMVKSKSGTLYKKEVKDVFEFINKTFKTLPFSLAHLDFYRKDYAIPMKLLTARKFIDAYPPLVDSPGSHVAQFEHTIYIKDGEKIILSKGDDY